MASLCLPQEVLVQIIETAQSACNEPLDSQSMRLNVCSLVSKAWRAAAENTNANEVYLGPIIAAHVDGAKQWLQARATGHRAIESLYFVPFSVNMPGTIWKMKESLERCIDVARFVGSRVQYVIIMAPDGTEETTWAELTAQNPNSSALNELLWLLSAKPSPSWMDNVTQLAIGDPVALAERESSDAKPELQWSRPALWHYRNSASLSAVAELASALPKLEALILSCDVHDEPGHWNYADREKRAFAELRAIEGLSMQPLLRLIFDHAAAEHQTSTFTLRSPHDILPLDRAGDGHFFSMAVCHEICVAALIFDSTDTVWESFGIEQREPWSLDKAVPTLRVMMAGWTHIDDFDAALRYFRCFPHLVILNLGHLGIPLPGQSDAELLAASQKTIENVIKLIPELGHHLQCLLLQKGGLSTAQILAIDSACERRALEIVWAS